MQPETEYFRRVYEATYEDMLRYAAIKTRRAADVEILCLRTGQI